MTRLGLLRRGAVAGVTGVAAGSLLQISSAEAAPEAAPLPLQFFTQWEFDYVTAMAETIWPTDNLGPGAREAGVGNYIDGQLAGSWGQGHRFYLNGPFFTPADTGHGWQIPMTPADVYRAFLPGYDAYVRTTFGNAYPNLSAAQQTTAMTALQTGKAT
ncbi:MAG TPA: gluconate 2-dehydrogenase subunit 3 family protein, partial [Gaiellaceae bacterium]|nr:gluconate 2-dehydrogenase subunit 3 family protein [Gaiellaceae bacterium]